MHIVELVVLDPGNVDLVYFYLCFQELEVSFGDKQNVTVFKCLNEQYNPPWWGKKARVFCAHNRSVS